MVISFEEFVEQCLIPADHFSFEHFAASVHQGAWPDVMGKAKRLIMDGQVTILYNKPTFVMAHVIGDHGEYDVEISRHDPDAQLIEQWQCECPWSQYAWGRTLNWKQFEGRPCSHVLATYWKSKGTPLDTSDMPPGFQPPRGQQGPGGAGPKPTPPAGPGGGPHTFDENTPPFPAENLMDQLQQKREEVKDRIQRGELYVPGQGQNTPQNLVIPARPEWGDMFQPPEQDQPTFQHLHLYDIAAPPGGQPVPPQLPVSVPGGRPPTPSNPIQFGGFSKVLGFHVVHNGGKLVRYAADDFEQWVGENLANGVTPIAAISRRGINLEMRHGKQPVPGSAPIGMTNEGMPVYRVMDLGWDPLQQRRVNADEVQPGGPGAPEQRNEHLEAPLNYRCEIHDIQPLTREVYIAVPLKGEQGWDLRLHPRLLQGWVEYGDVRPVAAPGQTPFIRRRQ